MKLPQNTTTLNKLLWLDTFLGGSTGLIGLCFFNGLESLLGLSVTFIITVSAITFSYAVVAFVLALQKTKSLAWLKVLIFANWLWALVSIGLIILYFNQAYVLGKAFLLLQVLVVGGLAYTEARQLDR